MLQGSATFDDQGIHYRSFESQSNVRFYLLIQRAFIFSLVNGIQGIGFQTAEGKIQAGTIGHRAGKTVLPLSTLFRKGSYPGATRIIQPQHFRSFIERLAGGIIHRFTQHLVLTNAIHPH